MSTQTKSANKSKSVNTKKQKGFMMIIITNLITAVVILIAEVIDVYCLLLVIAAVFKLVHVANDSQLFSKLSNPAISLVQRLFKNRNLTPKAAFGIALLVLMLFRLFVIGILIDLAQLPK